MNNNTEGNNPKGGQRGGRKSRIIPNKDRNGWVEMRLKKGGEEASGKMRNIKRIRRRRGEKGYKGVQRVTKGYKGLQRGTKGYKGVQRDTNRVSLQNSG